jgi:hypothetical protein
MLSLNNHNAVKGMVHPQVSLEFVHKLPWKFRAPGPWPFVDLDDEVDISAFRPRSLL